MKVIFLGNGTLGPYLGSHFSKIYQIKIISLRNIKLLGLKEYVKNLSSKVFIIDLMDPNTINNKTEHELIHKARKIRELFCETSQINQYLYLSSSNIYAKSKEIIYEEGEIISNGVSDYLDLKLSTETLLKNYDIPLSLCRVPNVWGHLINNSFFSDLIKVYKQKTTINYLNNDNELISYIHINDLSKLLAEVLNLKMIGIINISTDSYNSRFNLKALLNNDNLIKTNNLLGIRLASKKLFWKNFIKRTRLPF
tara:strand:- start:518 stop:1276 length:759 start_codon:yes stop_codon:yes gene_type:complete